MSKLYEKYKESGIQIVALSIDADGPKAVQPLINKLKITLPVYWVGTPALGHYKISAIPVTMVYDKGQLVRKLPGSYPRRVIEKIIKDLQSGPG